MPCLFLLIWPPRRGQKPGRHTSSVCRLALPGSGAFDRGAESFRPPKALQRCCIFQRVFAFGSRIAPAGSLVTISCRAARNCYSSRSSNGLSELWRGSRAGPGGILADEYCRHVISASWLGPRISQRQVRSGGKAVLRRTRAGFRDPGRSTRRSGVPVPEDARQRAGGLSIRRVHTDGVGTRPASRWNHRTQTEQVDSLTPSPRADTSFGG